MLCIYIYIYILDEIGLCIARRGGIMAAYLKEKEIKQICDWCCLMCALSYILCTDKVFFLKLNYKISYYKIISFNEILTSEASTSIIICLFAYVLFCLNFSPANRSLQTLLLYFCRLYLRSCSFSLSKIHFV